MGTHARSQPLGRSAPSKCKQARKGNEASMHCTRPHGQLYMSLASSRISAFSPFGSANRFAK
eukprot:13272252-Alexandrium_andersonii.AAC.1